MRLKIFADKPFLTIYEWNRYFYQGRVAFSSARLKTAAFPLGLFCNLGNLFMGGSFVLMLLDSDCFKFNKS